jgi:hypothetical protein
LKAAIDRDVDNYSGQSREEYDQAAPHLKGLLDCADPEHAVLISAGGHASYSAGERTYASVAVEIRQVGKLVE